LPPLCSGRGLRCTQTRRIFTCSALALSGTFETAPQLPIVGHIGECCLHPGTVRMTCSWSELISPRRSARLLLPPCTTHQPPVSLPSHPFSTPSPPSAGPTASCSSVDYPHFSPQNARVDFLLWMHYLAVSPPIGRRLHMATGSGAQLKTAVKTPATTRSARTLFALVVGPSTLSVVPDLWLGTAGPPVPIAKGQTSWTRGQVSAFDRSGAVGYCSGRPHCRAALQPYGVRRSSRPSSGLFPHAFGVCHKCPNVRRRLWCAAFAAGLVGCGVSQYSYLAILLPEYFASRLV